MKKNTRNLIITGACVLVLGGAAAALLLVPGLAEPAASSAAASSKSAPALIDKTVADLATLKVKNEAGGYTLNVSADSSADGGYTYTVPELSGVKVETSALSSAAAAGYTLKAEKELGEVDFLGDYGLDEPAATVTATYNDGGTYAYIVGNEAPSGDYYVSPLGTALVYTAPVSEYVLGGAAGMASTTMIAAPADGVNKQFDLLRLSGESFLEPINISKNDEPDLIGNTAYSIDDPKKLAMDDSAITAITAALNNLTATEVLAVYPSASLLNADLAKYGLDRPAAIAEFTMDGSTTTRIYVSATKDNSRNAWITGSNAVYSVSEASVEVWAEASLWNLQRKLIFMTNIVDVSHVDVVQGEKKWTVESLRTEEVPAVSSAAASDAAGSTPEKKYTYAAKKNGTDVADYETYRDFYMKAISMAVLEPVPETDVPMAEPYLSLSYNYYEELSRAPVELLFFKTDDRRCLVRFGGVDMGLVPIADLDALVASLEAIK